MAAARVEMTFFDEQEESVDVGSSFFLDSVSESVHGYTGSASYGASVDPWNDGGC